MNTEKLLAYLYIRRSLRIEMRLMVAGERVRAMFEFTEFDPDEVHDFMDSREAAAFLGLPYASFKEIAPGLPRHAITPARFGYLRRELLEHFRGPSDD